MFLLDFSSFAQHLDVGHVYVVCMSALHFQPVHDPTARRSMASTNKSLLTLFRYLSGWPWSSFLLQPLIPPFFFSPAAFILVFQLIPPSPLTIPWPLSLISSSPVKWFPIHLPEPLSPSTPLIPSTPLNPCSLPPPPHPFIPLSLHPSSPPLCPLLLSDLCQSSPGALWAQTAGITPLKDDGGSRS